MNEPTALDLAAIREQLDNRYTSPVQLDSYVRAALDELERCRAERDALRAALTNLVESCDAGVFVPRRPDPQIYEAARAVLGEVTPCGLRDAIAQALADTTSAWDVHPMAAASIAANAVRDWLALPPSEEEIGARFNQWQATVARDRRSVGWPAFRAGYLASRAVLVPPPEDEKGMT